MRFIEDREFLGEIEWNEGYEWSVIGVWRDDEGRFYLGTDSGCSCNGPWDSTPTDALTGPLTLDQAAEEVVNLWNAERRRFAEEDVRGLLGVMLESFMREVDLTWRVNDAAELPGDDRVTLVDANGEEWSRDNYWGEFTNDMGDKRNDWALAYPAVIKEVSE